MSLKIHIAGMAVAIGPFRRQLCAWCGEVLFDYDLRNVMVSPGSGEPTPWKMADLVARDGMAWYSVPMPPDDEPLPSECCVPRPERPAPQLKVVK